MNNSDDCSFLPPHEPTPVAGFHAYTQKLNACPGETVDLRVSNDGPVNIEIVKFRSSCQQTQPIAALSGAAARVHPIHRGSYVFVESAPELAAAFTIELWFRTLSTTPMSGLIGASAWSISLDEGNAAAAELETVAGTLRLSGLSLSLKTWHHLAVTCDGLAFRLYVDGQLFGEPRFAEKLIPKAGPLRLGALENRSGLSASFFTGDICGPALYARALTAAVIGLRFARKNTRPESNPAAHWVFDTVGGAPCRDDSGGGFHGRPVNYPLRMIPGPARTQDSDWSTYDPLSDPSFGHAIRFIADQCADCRWPLTAEWRIPGDLASGQYGARIRNERNETRLVHFIVRPEKPSARLMCISTTNTRVAYTHTPFGDKKLDSGAYTAHPSYPMLQSLIGARRPASGVSDEDNWLLTTVDFELPFYEWLDREHIAYDLYSEWDIDANPEIFAHYDVIAWAGHSEYWTRNQYEGLSRFLKRGGRILSLSGNTAFWRVSLDRENGMMEVRKHERKVTPGTDFDPVHFSAHIHQMDHLPGCNMRRAGWPEWRLLGSVSAGWTSPPLHGPRTAYEVLAPEHPLFKEPRRIDTSTPFAPGAAGYETDLTLRSMFTRFGLPREAVYPPHDGSAPLDPQGDFDAGLTVLARARIPGSDLIDYENNYSHKGGEMWAEMTLWERPGLGPVFTTGSVLSAEALLTNLQFSNLILNVLDYFQLRRS